MTGQLVFEDGTTFEGKSFGAKFSCSGEVVFSTGMVGYPESLTDPSYAGQILILTYPLIGNYGVPDKRFWESDKIQVSGLIVSNYIDTPSHHQSERTLSQWLTDEKIPALEISDTRFLTQKLREKGVMLGKIVIGKDVPFYDPNRENLVAKVSTRRFHLVQGGTLTKNAKKILLFDCGAKRNIIRCLAERRVEVVIVPWDFDPFDKSRHLGRWRGNDLDSSEVERFDAIVVSNGPGDPKMAVKTIRMLKKALNRKIPILGVCLGHQLLALGAGGDTYKLKFGHRSQNQPCLLAKSPRCFITTQNHGFAVSDKLPKGFKPWFVNANDGSNEGMIHEKLPIMSVQFHPEANPGPMDTEWVFDYFLERI